MTVPFFGILLGGAIWSNCKLRQENKGKLSIQASFWHTYALFAMFWLFDLTILDWLIFVTWTPNFIVLPGTEGMTAYKDYGFHLKVALPALPFMALPAMVVAYFMQGQKE